MQKLDANQLISAVFLPALVLAIGLFGYLILWPKYQNLNAERGVLKAKEEDVKSRQNSLASVNGLIEELKNSQDKLQSIDEALPTAPRIPELLANMDYLASQSGLLISNLQISPGPSLEPTGPEGFPVQIDDPEIMELLSSTESLGLMTVDGSFRGRYVNLQTFLLNLEQNLRLQDVQSLTLGEVDQESGLQDFNLKIQIYYQKE
ncbi:MAG: type 4a pilus biogenesis protein PilO [bacterium]|nr:type 4a pilus biogenesis protein PilO [bacterium]